MQRVARLRARPDVDQGYLGHVVGSPAFTDHVLAVQTGSAVPHISGKQIAEFDMGELPPLTVQHGIGETLSNLDEKVALNRRLVETLRSLACATLNEASEAPKSYLVGDVAEVRKGLSYRGAGLADSGMPMVNMGNAANFGWLKRSGFKHYVAEYKDRHVAPPGSLIITSVEQTWRHEIIGWPLLVPEDMDPVLFSHHMLLVDFKPGYEWLRLPLWAHLFRPETRARLEGMVYGTTVATLPVSALQELEFAAPESPSSQALLLAHDMLRRAWAAENESEALVALRDALLPGLLSGRISVPEAHGASTEAIA